MIDVLESLCWRGGGRDGLWQGPTEIQTHAQILVAQSKDEQKIVGAAETNHTQLDPVEGR